MRMENCALWVTAVLVATVAVPVQAQKQEEAENKALLSCVCPFYYYGPTGTGTYYYYANTYVGSCSNVTITFDEFDAMDLYGYCNTQCQGDCQSLLISSEESECCGSSKTPKGKEAEPAAESKKTEQGLKSLTDRFGVPVPVPRGLTHRDVYAKENEIDIIRPVGEPITVKFCKEGDCSGNVKYIKILRYEKAVNINGIINFHQFAIAFESQQPLGEAPRLSPTALSRVTTRGREQTNLLLGRYGVTPFILLVQDGTIDEWVN